MTPAERRRHFADAEAAFAALAGVGSFKPYCMADRTDPGLEAGDWVVVGVLAVERAIELVQHVVVVNRISGERRIVKGWGKVGELREV